MKRCKHENAEHVMAGECCYTMDGEWIVDPALCEQFRCLDCRAWLSLGPANDEPEAVRLEMRLADLLAQAECHWDPCGAKDEECEMYIDIFADDTAPNPNVRPANRPLTPIERMIDEACGVSR